MDEKKVKRLQDTFDDSVGITTTFKADYTVEDHDEGDEENADKTCKRKTDPVTKHKKEIVELCLDNPPVAEEPQKLKKQVIEPTISTRLKLKEIPFDYAHAKVEGIAVKFEEPRDPDGCDIVRLPSPIIRDSILTKVQVGSPDVSKASFKPTIPSHERNSRFFLPQPPPRRSFLDPRQIHSGIYVNVEEEVKESYVYDGPNPPRGKKKKKPIIPPSEPSSPQDIIDDMLALENYYTGGGEDQEDVERIMYESRSTHMSDNIILGKYGVILSNASSATSMQPKEGPPYEDVSWCDIPVVSKLVQTLREAHLSKPKKTFKKGALENHSFTDLHQKVCQDFCYKCTSGSMHQGDATFLKISRDNQGVCMPVTAFCYASLYDPLTWSARNVDEIVELGNNLYMESMAELHMHGDRKQLTVYEIQTSIIIHEKKVKYEILEPSVKGLIRSMDKRICNLTSGLRLFFHKFQSCILRTEELCYLIWKPRRKHFFFFDATARKNNLYQNPNGTAVFAYVQKMSSIVSILLERTALGNAAFNISEIRVQRIMGKDEVEKPVYVSEMNTYRVLNERQAVVQGSFDLGDVCFQFTRNKQALAMSLIAVAYSRLSAPHNWHRKTLDKIMVVGNQLHQLCMAEDCCNEVTIENLPSVFTIGAFIVEVHLFPNRNADLMFKKGECAFLGGLAAFFERNSNAICQIGKSFMAIWSQRGMYFCFDPYTRNKEGLKCRSGACCVTMNKDLETLVETILQNFENREAIFYLHALKIVKIQRDIELSKIFPRYLTLHEISVDVFKKHRLRKSKRKAVEKPVSVDFKNRALRTLLATQQPTPSVCDLASTLESLNTNFALPACFEAKLFAKAPQPKKRDPGDDNVVDLDSPTLSDTQIPPKQPCPYEPGDIPIDDLDSYELTQEEKEIEDTPEGEGEGEAEGLTLGVGIGGEEDIKEGTESDFNAVRSQVTSGELEPCYTVHQMNTDLTYCYKLLPARELKTKSPKDRILNIDELDQDEQLAKLRNFTELRPGVQILRARTDCLTVAEGYNPHLVVPYMCIMASAFALEVPLNHWEKRTIDFVMKAGIVLFNNHCENFVKIDDFKFVLMKNTLFCTVEVIFNTYIGDGLFETFSGQQDLEKFLEYHVFSKEDCGIVVMPHYACAVFYKHYLFYLFEPFNCDKEGNMQENDAHGKSCLMRFKSLDELIAHLVDNLSKRVSEMDENMYEFRLMTLAKPVFLTSEEKARLELNKEEQARDEDIIVARTQSEELKRPDNFVTLPDGSQLIRGKTKVNDCGEEVEFIAPYVCIMASAVGEKFAVRSWSGDVVDFIIEAGCALYKKSKYRFSQLAKLDIPKVTLGHANYRIECRYLFDAPMKIPLMKASIKRVVTAERDWAVLVTEVYSCAVFQRNGLLYLFDPFPCNELGLEDGAEGAACVARFKNFHDLCIRIVFNKNKREDPEKVEYTRFILTVCRGGLLPPEPKKRKRKPEIGLPETVDEENAPGGGEGVDDEEEEEMGLVGDGGDQMDEAENPNKIGYQPNGKFELIEGHRSLPRPEPNQATLNEDHFVCLVAAIVVTCRPLANWDTKTVNRVMDLGRHIYDNADELSISKKRTIRNILVGKFFMDIIVRMITIEDYKHNRNFNAGLSYIMNKRKFCIIQLQSGTFVYYADNENGLVHLFHPYPVKLKGKEGEEEAESKCCWMKFKTERACRNYLRTSNPTHNYFFYTYNVVNIAKAPRNMVITHRIQEYIRLKQRGECYGKPFNERESWLDLHRQPWSRVTEDGAVCGKERDSSCRWFYWDIEYQKDLYSLAGTIHPTSKEFHSANRGKQTLAVTVAAIGMTGIYDLKEWNSNIIDAIVRAGDKYYRKCVEDIHDANHEFKMADLLEECVIQPYKFRVRHQSVVDGTMFLMHFRKYNLYKALRYFFDDFYYRAGVIIAVLHGVKRMVAFSKKKENEYYMFDCQAFGPPMFANRKGTAYILMCTTLARLVHVLTLTLRGGDFFIYEVIADQYETYTEQEKDG